VRRHAQKGRTMSDVTTSVDVRVPIRTAYNQWTQFESFPEFMSGVTEVRQLDDRRLHWVTEVAGARREFNAEIVEQLPDRRIAWRSTDGDLRHLGTVTFEPAPDGGTRVTVDLLWEPQGLVEKAGSALGVDNLQIKADLERFRRFIEERGTETGQWRGEVRPPGTADTEPLPAYTEATQPPAAGTWTPPADQMSTGQTSADQTSADVVDVLMAQHEQVKSLMDQVASTEGPQKQQLFADIVDLLKTHEKGEQRVVHPVTRSSVQDGAATANARLGEEERADQLLAEMEGLTVDSVEFDAWFDRLRHAVLAHAEHEEREEFPKLRRELAPERLRTMADELVAAQNARN
jgi:uncharacterized membrane protein/hemerythrin superfamily protein